MPTSPQRPPVVSTGLLAVLVFLLAGYVAFERIWPMIRASNATPRAIEPRGDLSDAEQSTIAIFEKASPSVVFVTNAQMRRDRLTRNVMSVPAGSGSGFVWDDMGHIVTNLHVIADADRLIVTLPDQSNYEASVVGYSARYDVAVLRVNAPPGVLQPIPVGESENLRVGQAVFAIGNPFGLDQTLTTGVISALHREISGTDGRELEDMIQTDAAINPGNSGGPLLDSAGRLIGINTAIISPTNTSAGIGFATPVDRVNELVPDLIAHGQEMRPYLGVYLDETYPQRLGIEGVLVLSIQPRSPAERAGLQASRVERGRMEPGDFILAIDGQTTTSAEDVREILGEHQVGDEIELTILRDNRRAKIIVPLEMTRP